MSIDKGELFKETLSDGERRVREELDKSQQATSLYKMILRGDSSHINWRRIDLNEIPLEDWQIVFAEAKVRWQQKAKEMSVGDFLRQTRLTTELDENKCRLVEEYGFFIVVVDEEIYPRRQVQATAVYLRDGVSFILVPDYYDNKRGEEKWNNLLLHEGHHLLWRVLRRQGKGVMIKEKDEDWEEAFWMFQDECIARIVGRDIGVRGYSPWSLDSDRRKEFMSREPVKYERIMGEVASVNDLLEELEFLLRSKGVDRDSLFLAIVGAKNFASLKVNLLKVKELVGKLPNEKGGGELDEELGGFLRGWSDVVI